ncbi:MAG: hypothetical protein KJZ85_04505 [Rhodobacteraceae bacterium]|jgi:hypothetical protein|nr:hypothetical protein [Paracoccaceae bacterium]
MKGNPAVLVLSLAVLATASPLPAGETSGTPTEAMLEAGAEVLVRELGPGTADAATLRRAAGAAFAAMSQEQWQPIQSAPLDRVILLARIRAEAVDIALGQWEVTDDWPYDGGRWSVTYLWEGDPTHWLEVPAPVQSALLLPR